MYLWIRFAKVVSVALLCSGTVGVFVAKDHASKRRFAYLLAGPGFGLTWGFGFALVAVTSASLSSTWILGAIGLSIVSLQAVLYVAGKAGRGGPVSAAVGLVPLALCLWLMVWRPQ